jgi:hypothetical protein
MVGARSSTQNAPPRRHTIVALIAAAAGCSLSAGSRGFPGEVGATSDDGGGGSGGGHLGDAGGSGMLGGGTCSALPPPAGPKCACHFTSCHGCAVECDCAPDCYESTGNCLVTVDASGTVHTSDPLLSTGTLACKLHAAVPGEIPQPAQMVCTTTDCHAPVPPPPGSAPEGGASSGGQVPVAEGGSDTGIGEGVDAGACPVPVPGPVILSGPVWGEYQVHFYVPFPSWAFASAHASRQTYALGAYGLRETPSFYFATALKESYMGCSDKLPPYNPYMPGYLYTRTLSYASGCLQIDSTSAWVEMCRMYPQSIDCNVVQYADVIPSTNQDQIGRDNFASSAFVKTYYDIFAYAMLPTHDMPMPSAWFSAASDPQAMVKMIALLYNEGAWTGDATAVADRCHQDLVENCLGNKDYVVAVSSYDRELEATVAAGNCYNDMIAIGDVDDYVSKIVPLFTHENAAMLTAAGRAAFLRASGGAMSAPFQQVAGAVLDAIDGAMQAHAHCPDAELNQWYMRHCPN